MTGKSSDVSGPILASLPTINLFYTFIRRDFMILIKRGSFTHVALMYLKMKKTWVTKQNLFDLSPTKYKKLAKARDALDKLVFLGYAIKEEDRYHINQLGIDVLPLIVKNQKFVIDSRDDYNVDR